MRRGPGRKAESHRGEWKEIFHFFFSFSNISNAFSNSFCNPFLLEVKNQSITKQKYATACMHKHVSNLIIDFIYRKSFL
jgi:hypothetical protein